GIGPCPHHPLPSSFSVQQPLPRPNQGQRDERAQALVAQALFTRLLEAVGRLLELALLVGVKSGEENDVREGLVEVPGGAVLRGQRRPRRDRRVVISPHVVDAPQQRAGQRGGRGRVILGRLLKRPRGGLQVVAVQARPAHDVAALRREGDALGRGGLLAGAV